MRLTLLLILPTLAGTSLIAQQREDFRRLAGEWRPLLAQAGMPENPPQWMTRNHFQAMIAHLSDVAKIFQKAPVLNQPVGFVVFSKSRVVFLDQRSVVPGDLRIGAIRWDVDAAGKPVAYDFGVQALTFNIEANQFGCIYGVGGYRSQDVQGAMYLEPKQWGTLLGYPVFGENPRCVIVTRRTAPLFIPVTQERLLTQRIVETEKALAEWKSQYADLANRKELNDAEKYDYDLAAWGIEKAEGALKKQREQLASFNAETRRAPAYSLQDSNPLQPLASRDTPDARMVVQPNPDFFDATRPADIQVLQIAFEGEPELLEKLLEQLDWNALAAMTR